MRMKWIYRTTPDLKVLLEPEDLCLQEASSPGDFQIFGRLNGGEENVGNSAL